MLTSANTPNEDVLGLRDLYAAKCSEAGVAPRWEDMPFFRVTYVAEDQKTAEKSAVVRAVPRPNERAARMKFWTAG